MNFNEFSAQIEYLKAIEPGGLKSQFKMAPKERKSFVDSDIKSLNPRKAAVVALFYPNISNETTFLLTLRSNYKGVHASQISFPGGKFETNDKYLKKTAIRETYEEVGVELNKAEIIKEMTTMFIPPSNFIVSPFIGKISTKPNFNTNHEVDKIIEVKLADLLDKNSISSKMMSTSYMENIEVPCFVLNDYVVWGATAMILSEIKDLFSNIN